jgi:NitT/TauT family transport system ATP-binding protein
MHGALLAVKAKPALQLENLSKQYGSAHDPIRALDGISLEVREGEFLSIIGPSGCGKSTLFRIIGGLIRDWEGRMLVNGVPLTSLEPSIGIVFQEESTFPWLTVLENAEFALKARGLPRPERRERALHFLKLVGLHDFAHRYPAELSGGMRQRTAIARTLAAEPHILLMDEPFAAVDEQTRLLLGDRVLKIHHELRQTTVLITHNITEAVQLSDRVAIMTFRPGRIKRVVDIDLPRPRGSDMVSNDRFLRYVGILWNDLREEASKGLEAAEHTVGSD